MNKRRFYVKLVASIGLAVVIGWSPVRALAQMPGQIGGGNLLTAVMIRLLDTNTAFTAKTEFHVFDKSHKETDTVPMTLTMVDSHLRMDVDMNQVKVVDMLQGLLPALRNLGMDQQTVIMRMEKKQVTTIYPKAKCYAEMPLTKDEIATSEKKFKMEKVSEGKELIDGKQCDKQKVTLTTDKGEKSVATTWNAPDLKDFPVQMELQDGDATVVVKFKDVKLAKPDAKQFEVPAGMTKYDSAEALRDALVAKGRK